jgi:hypothetical protein
MVDKSELAIATSQTQNPILFNWIIIELIVSNDYCIYHQAYKSAREIFDNNLNIYTTVSAFS